MTQAQQPEALRLAAICETKGMFPVADELNRMHARILELEQGKCLHQITEPPTQVVDAAPSLGDAWKTLLLDGSHLERDKYGCGYHPALPNFDEGVNGRKFFAVFGIELKASMAENEMELDAYEAMTEDGPNYNVWNPERPKGDGWHLVAIFDTEDGPACWWLREVSVTDAKYLDDLAVDDLASLMKEKLAKQREKGYGGWNKKRQCTQQHLSDLLRKHVGKGDPVDVANFCAFLLARGEGITAEGTPLPLLMRDIARDIGISVPEACVALKPWGDYSTNSAVTAEMATRLREAFPNPAPQAVQAAVPDGWKLVPVEPTREMLDAYVAADGRFHSGRTDWAVMLNAAPAHPAEGVPAAIDPNECGQDVFNNGVSVGLFDIPKDTANAICVGISEATGVRLDWHYIAGRVHIKVLVVPQPAAQGMDAQQYRIIDHGELIQAGDEFLRDDFTWQIDPKGIFVGTRYGIALRPARRAIAAQAKHGGADHG